MEIMEKEYYSLYDCVNQTRKTYENNIAYDFMGKRVSYANFLKQIDITAAALVNLGIKEDDVVAIAMPNTPQAITMIYATNKIGAVVNMIHPLSSENEFKELINKVNAKIILILDTFYEKLEKIQNDISVDRIIVASIDETLPFFKSIAYRISNKKISIKKTNKTILWHDFLSNIDDNITIKAVTNRKDSLALLLYSGGTTGKVKAVCLSNRQINESAKQMFEANPMICDKDSFLSVMPIFHGNGLVIGVHLMLMAGAKCVLIPRFTPKSYAKDLLKNKCNYMSGVPSLYERLLDLDIMKNADLSFLKGAFSGADYLSVDLEKRLNDFFIKHNAKIIIRQGYGMTEGVVATTLNPYDKSKEGSIGIPLKGVEVKIVKPDSEIELTNGEIGEIVFSSVTNMMGYLNDEEETNKTLRLHSDGKYWIHSGDLGSKDDEGYLYFKGRIKRMIVTNGYNVFPNELENIIESFDMVERCCVIGVPHVSGTDKIKAFIILKKGYEKDDNTKEQILSLCKAYIAKYALPKYIEFIDSMPKTKVGKVDYNVLLNNN